MSCRGAHSANERPARQKVAWGLDHFGGHYEALSFRAMAETTIPLMPCTSLEVTLDFYRKLGFEATHDTEPHPYGTARRGSAELHFTRLTMYGAKNAFGAALVLVDEVARHHRAFANALRSSLGKVPVAGLPRLTRLRPGQTRFAIFDPSGNLVMYIDRMDADAYTGWDGSGSALMQALGNAAFLRDTYYNDDAAARVLDVALERHPETPALERARVLAARAELAVAMGDAERSRALRIARDEISLSSEDRNRFQEELNAPEDLERWLAGGEAATMEKGS
jgi:hypothetical protein